MQVLELTLNMKAVRASTGLRAHQIQIPKEWMKILNPIGGAQLIQKKITDLDEAHVS